MSYSTLVLGWVMLAGAAHAQAGGSSKAGMMQVRPLPDDAMKLQAKIAAKIVPTARLKIQGAAIKVRTQPAENSTEMLAHARTAAWESFPSAKIGDVDTLTFLVMMQAATDAQNELTAMMEATDKEKQAPRGAVQTMSDISTEMHMKVQMEQQQYSQCMEALSNIMKKVSNTSYSIVQTMK